MKTGVIVQTRTTSSRLPGKVLLKVAGKTLLEYLIERLKRIQGVDQIVIATTTNVADEPIVKLSTDLGLPYYRGSELDVLTRFYESAKHFNIDPIVRITSDCPLVDTELAGNVIHYYHKHRTYDYVANCHDEKYPKGMDCEVFSFLALEITHRNAHLDIYREHVTPYIYQNPDKFSLYLFKEKKDYSKYRLTVDEKEDFELIKIIIEALYDKNPHFGLEDIVYFLNEHPELIKINANIRQTTI